MTSQGPYFTDFIRPTKSADCDNKIRFMEKTNQNNLLGFLQNNSKYSIFNHMVQLSNMAGIYNSDQMYMTLFVVTDDDIKKHYPEIIFMNMDILTAKTILLNYTLDRNISLDMLRSSNGMYLVTKSGNRLLCRQDEDGNIFLNGDIKVYDKIEKVDNAIILFADNIVMPPNSDCQKNGIRGCY